MSIPTPHATDPRDRRPRLILQAAALRDMEAGLPVSMELAVALRMDMATFFVVDDVAIEASRLPFATHIGSAARWRSSRDA